MDMTNYVIGKTRELFACCDDNKEDNVFSALFWFLYSILLNKIGKIRNDVTQGNIFHGIDRNLFSSVVNEK